MAITSTTGLRSWAPTAVVAGTAAATAGNYGIFWRAPVACIVSGAVSERHEVAGSNGGSVIVMLKKVPSGTAISAGTDCLAAGLDLKATANTDQAGALHATAANYTLAAGDCLALYTASTLTSVAGVALSVSIATV